MRNKRALFFASVWLGMILGTVYWIYRARQVPEGAYGMVALQINKVAQGTCDKNSAERRLALARVIDIFRPRIHGLWEGRKAGEFPEFKMVQVGPVFLRLNPKKEEASGSEESNWSWEDAASTYLKTQNEAESPETIQRWRDLDTMVRFLMERDAARVLHGRKYLEPSQTEHQFRPNSSVTRKSANVFEVKLDAGDFKGAQGKLGALFTKQWSSRGRRVEIKWVEKDPAAYRIEAYARSGRSYVSHKEKLMMIANFSAVNTVAHELGHVLGFDDHYYSVWNEKNCYYTQEARRADLMSSSEQGVITAQHWSLLDRAYPLGKPALNQAFAYYFKD